MKFDKFVTYIIIILSSILYQFYLELRVISWSVTAIALPTNLLYKSHHWKCVLLFFRSSLFASFSLLKMYLLTTFYAIHISLHFFLPNKVLVLVNTFVYKYVVSGVVLLELELAGWNLVPRWCLQDCWKWNNAKGFQCC